MMDQQLLSLKGDDDMDKVNYKLVNFAIVIVIFFLLVKTSVVWINLLNTIKQITLPIIISFVIAYSLNPLVKGLNKKIKSNNIATCIILVIIFLVLSLVLYYSIPLIVNQIISLSKNIVPFIENLFLQTTFINMAHLEEMIIENINNLVFSLSNSPIKIVVSSLSFISNFIIVVILSIYFLFNMEKIKTKILSLFEKKQKIINCLREIDVSLNNYLRGLFLIIFIETIEYTLIYLIVGHPNYLLLGILAGITTIIPYFGNLFTNILALITAASISNELFIICAIIVLVVPIIDCYVIDPKIYHKTTNLNPIKVILSIIVASTIFGVFGILIAVPLYLTIEVLIKTLNQNKFS